MHMAGVPRRDDITVLDVALKWVNGMTHVSIAAEYGASVELIQRRLKQARATYPDLPWEKRDAAIRRGPTVAYRLMNDGNPGTSGTSASAFRSRST
jgi:hypothetical protein